MALFGSRRIEIFATADQYWMPGIFIHIHTLSASKTAGKRKIEMPFADLAQWEQAYETPRLSISPWGNKQTVLYLVAFITHSVCSNFNRNDWNRAAIIAAEMELRMQNKHADEHSAKSHINAHVYSLC